jgi:hypothetical protein
MPVRMDWEIHYDQQQLVAAMGGSFERLLKRPGMQEAWNMALAEAEALVSPALTWEAPRIREIRHEFVVLDSGQRIGGGPVTTVVGGAEELIVAVCTVGKPVSDRIAEHQRAGRMMEGFLLDSLGSWSVDLVRQQFCRWCEQDATDRGLRVSASLSPGESEWSVKDQAAIFRVVDGTSIGVSLTESLVMSPLKSLSLIIGRGSRPMGVEGASNCDFCTIRDRCTFRGHRHGVSAA